MRRWGEVLAEIEDFSTVRSAVVLPNVIVHNGERQYNCRSNRWIRGDTVP